MAPTSFVYPRTIQVKRSASQSGVGAQSYASLDRSAETIILDDVAASIQEKNTSQDNRVELPADGKMSIWRVYIGPAECQRKGIGPGYILSRDWVIDDAGERYHVLNNYWDSLGYALTVEKQEA